MVATRLVVVHLVIIVKCVMTEAPGPRMHNYIIMAAATADVMLVGLNVYMLGLARMTENLFVVMQNTHCVVMDYVVMKAMYVAQIRCRTK